MAEARIPDYVRIEVSTSRLKLGHWSELVYYRLIRDENAIEGYTLEFHRPAPPVTFLPGQELVAGFSMLPDDEG